MKNISKKLLETFWEGPLQELLKIAPGMILGIISEMMLPEILERIIGRILGGILGRILSGTPRNIVEFLGKIVRNESI